MSLERHQRGQSMTEFVIIIPVLALLIFGAIQIGLIYATKNSLNYAAFQAARLGAVNNATYDGLQRGLVRGMAPMFTHEASRDAVEDGTQTAANEVANFVRITRISPRLDHFSPSGFGEYDGDAGEWTIPNDNLMFRNATDLSQNASIQDANLLKIRVQYCYRLMVPLVNRMIGKLSELTNGQPSPRFGELSRDEQTNYNAICGSRANDLRGFIVTSDVLVRMQSPAHRDDANCNNTMICL